MNFLFPQFKILIETIKNRLFLSSKFQCIICEESEIVAWLKIHRIERYSLVPDPKYSFKINVQGNVFIRLNPKERKYRRLPVKFGVIKGDFNCSYNDLTSLQGCPDEVWDNFDCSHNQLTTLKYTPKMVGSKYACNDNWLTSLIGEARLDTETQEEILFFPRCVGGLVDMNGNTSLKLPPPTVDSLKNLMNLSNMTPAQGQEFVEKRGLYSFEHLLFIYNQQKSIMEKQVEKETLQSLISEIPVCGSQLLTKKVMKI